MKQALVIKLKFQSLLGRLQTNGMKIIEGVVVKFQSLLGRLQTHQAISVLKAELKFQSLLGRLQTLRCYDSHNDLFPVSIPLR